MYTMHEKYWGQKTSVKSDKLARYYTTGSKYKGTEGCDFCDFCCKHQVELDLSLAMPDWNNEC